ncbi:MAG TPA: hypothetical protein VGO98_01050, partial [Candidatus Saccharimonadales bacterium]|nr:hypothetical protein [Candidatus Saccharimonadales bacterium]
MSIGHRRVVVSKNTFFLGAFLLILTLFSSVFLFSNESYAAPGKINYQGRLADATGTAKPDGQYNMKFRIYDASGGGTLVWSEVRETTTRVTVTNGQFNVQLGDVTPIPASAFSSDTRYFEVELPTPATATCETVACATYTEGAMTPRQAIASSAYALNAQDAATVGGINPVSIAKTNAVNSFAGANNFFGDVLVSRDGSSAFKVATTGNKSLFNIDTSNSVVGLGTGSGGSPSFGNRTFNELTLEADSTNRKFYSSYTTGSTAGAADKISVYIASSIDSSPDNKFKMAIYTGTAVTPTTLVATSTEGTLTLGWNSVPISATLSPNTTYWLG